MDIQVSVRFPESTVREVDKLVKSGVFINRADAIRDLVRFGLKEEAKT